MERLNEFTQYWNDAIDCWFGKEDGKSDTAKEQQLLFNKKELKLRIDLKLSEMHMPEPY